MSDKDKGSTHRDYRGVDGVVEDAQKKGESKFPRGRTGDSKPKSPKKWPTKPGKPREGSEGEPSYGAPIDDKPEDRGKE